MHTRSAPPPANLARTAPRCVLTPLHAGLVQSDGALAIEACNVLAELGRREIPLVVLSSRSAAELRQLYADVGATGWIVYEHGAAVARVPGDDVFVHPRVVQRAEILGAIAAARAAGARVHALEWPADRDAARATGLEGVHLEAFLARRYGVCVASRDDTGAELREALRSEPHLDVVPVARARGLFVVQGRHSPADALPAVWRELGEAASPTLALASDTDGFELLAGADEAWIIAGLEGPHPALVSALPSARVSATPGAAGWAAAVREALGLD